MGTRELTLVLCIIVGLFCLHKILQNVASLLVLKSLATEYGKDTATVERIFENNIRNYVSRVDCVDAENVNVEIDGYRIADYMELRGVTSYISGNAEISYIKDEHRVKKDISFRVEAETLDLNNMDLIVRMFD